MSTTPFTNQGNHDEPAVFTPEGLIREARRQKELPESSIPALGVLDPDGDILRHLRADGIAYRDPYWPCYHTELWRFATGFGEAGLVACAVGGPYAVLVAEQMFCCGCELLINITSAGQVSPIAAPPYFVLAEGALRDEGTSFHYLPPSRYVMLDAAHGKFAERAVYESGLHIERGLVWTTDAPFRETESAIAQARSENVLAVEMETAALYAFAQKKRKPVVSFAHVTNQMGQIDGDFEKGEAWGSAASLRLISAMARAWRGQREGVTP